ncbi:MAG: tellurite resistance TerB family protein [Hydrogenophilaceae bacterium]|jgi:hypothetical protein|nr:tellurite resistance TerB family protein [Hydrogenophilaceae bacterium]
MTGPTPEYRAFVEAGIGVCMAVILSDGTFSEDEFAWWKALQNRHPLFRDVPAEEFNPMLARVKARLLSEPWEGLVQQWAGAVPAQYREALLETASQTAIIDRKVVSGEPNIIRHIWRALGISDERGANIFASVMNSMR